MEIDWLRTRHAASRSSLSTGRAFKCICMYVCSFFIYLPGVTLIRPYVCIRWQCESAQRAKDRDKSPPARKTTTTTSTTSTLSVCVRSMYVHTHTNTNIHLTPTGQINYSVLSCCSMWKSGKRTLLIWINTYTHTYTFMYDAVKWGICEVAVRHYDIFPSYPCTYKKVRACYRNRCARVSCLDVERCVYYVP